MVSERQRDLAVVAGLGALAVAFFPGVLRGRVLVPWDVLRVYAPWQRPGPVHNLILSDPVRLYAPWRTLLGDALRRGTLPFWDPYVFGGTPFLANSQAAILYPPNLIYGLLAVDVATTVLILLHVWLAMVGMYLLARYSVFRLAQLPAGLAAVGFGFCGFAMVWAEFPTFAAVYAWLPWMMLALLRVMDGSRRFAVAGLGLSVAMAALGGHAQIFQYEALALVLVLVLGGLHSIAGSTRRAVSDVAAAIGGLAAGLLLAAPQLLATLQAGPLIVRNKESLEGLLASAFPVRLLPLVALPRAYGDSGVGNWFAPGNENEYVAFGGVIVLLLAPLALRRWRRMEVQAVLAIEVLAWAIALGTPVFRVLYTVVPAMNQIRGIGRATALHSFALPLLAAIGLDVLIALGSDPRTRRWAVGWGVAAVAAVGTLLLVDQHLAHSQFTGAYMMTQYLALLVPALAAIAILGVSFLPRPGLQKVRVLLPLLLAGELFLAYGQYNTADPGPNTFTQPNVVAAFLKSQPGRFVAYRDDELTGNTPLAYGLSTIGGSDTFILRDFADYYNLIENHEGELHLNSAPPLQTADALGSPLLPNLGVSSAVSQGQPQVPGMTPVFRAGLNLVSAIDRAHPLLRTLSCLQTTPTESDVLTLLANNPDLVNTRAITADSVPPTSACPAGAADPINDAVLSSVEIGPDGTASALVDGGKVSPVMYAETIYPGWTVQIDGQAAQLIRVDHALMAVAVPPGHHRVTFSFHSTHLQLGAVLAALAAAALLVGVVAPSILGRRRSRLAGKAPA